MKTVQARIDESVDELVNTLNAIVGEVALEALARRMRHKPRRVGQRRSAAAFRREPEEIAAVTDELYAQICRHPGETMLTLAAHLKLPAKKLAFPVSKLIKAGRVKKAGQRQFTRYFPVGQEAKQARARRRKTR